MDLSVEDLKEDKVNVSSVKQSKDEAVKLEYSVS
jgi:hypothetical protein